jgi:hypothetical protein
MQSTQLPASLKGVAAPLEEAAQYERVAIERRKGIFGLLSTLVLVFALAWKTLGGSLLSPFSPAGLVFLAMLFGMSFGLRAVLQRRPGWEPLFERPKGRRFWIRYAVSLVVLSVVVMGIGIFVFDSGSESMIAGYVAATMAGVGAVLLWLAPPTTPVRFSILLGSTAAAILLFSGVVPPTKDLEALLSCVALASIAESSYNLLAPRRWLLR